MATTDSMKQHKLRKLIAWLAQKEGKGKEFISLYLPRGKSVDDVVAALKSEFGSAEVKNDSGCLQEVLKNLIQNLKLHKEISENGFALFAGSFVASDLEPEVVHVEEIIPPEAITTYLQVIDNHFHLEPLREMLRNQKVVGILALDSKETSYGVLNGEHFELNGNITSGVHGKSGKGGSSQRRYERERDTELTHYFHRVADHAKELFLEKNKVNTLIIGGPGTTKEDFLKGDYLHYDLNNALVNIVDTQSASKEAVRETLVKSAEVLANMCAPEERRIMHRLLADMSKDNGLVTYGLDAVLNSFRKGEVEVVLVTDNSGMVEVVVVCKSCGFSRVQVVDCKGKVQTVQDMISRPCEKCSGVAYEVAEKDMVDVLEDLASQTNAKVEVISTESPEKQKLNELGGFAAILRYKSK
jgi:peptide chain release factor subunit 1